MTGRMVPRAHARDIAELCCDVSDKAHQWKDRAKAAESILARFIEWLDRADDEQDDASYLNGEHPEQREADRNGWDDVRDIGADARKLIERRS